MRQSLVVRDAHTTEVLFPDVMAKVLDEELALEGEAQLISRAQVVMRNAALYGARSRVIGEMLGARGVAPDQHR